MRKNIAFFLYYKHLSKKQKREAIKRRIVLILKRENILYRKYLYKKQLQNRFMLTQKKEIYLSSTLDKGISKDLFIYGE